jgi:ABC-type uncharacterized transport system permease subunit
MILANAYPNAAVLMLPLALAAALAYATPALASSRLSVKSSRTALWCAWCLHGLLLILGLTGAEPRFGFGPALSVTAWLVLTVYAVESRLFPKLEARWALAGLGSLTVILAWVFPGSPIRGDRSPWLPLHWVLGIASYGLFAAAVVHAWLMNRAEKQIRLAADPSSGIPLLTLERLTFRFATVGFVLLTATLLAGWLFGEHLYGTGAVKAMRWDHKTVFSVLSWAVFATLLLGRAYFGWRGRKATRVLYVGAGLLLLAYVGSRFVLEVLLGRSA